MPTQLRTRDDSNLICYVLRLSDFLKRNSSQDSVNKSLVLEDRFFLWSRSPLEIFECCVGETVAEWEDWFLIVPFVRAAWVRAVGSEVGIEDTAVFLLVEVYAFL